MRMGVVSNPAALALPTRVATLTDAAAVLPRAILAKQNGRIHHLTPGSKMRR